MRAKCIDDFRQSHRPKFLQVGTRRQAVTRVENVILDDEESEDSVNV